MASFHSRAGTLVRLSNDCRRASRTNPSQEFNNGVVISADPLNNNQLFEVKIEKKVNFNYTLSPLYMKRFSSLVHRFFISLQ